MADIAYVFLGEPQPPAPILYQEMIMSEKETFSNQANNLHRRCVIAPRNLRGALGLALSAGLIATMLVLLYIMADVEPARTDSVITQAPVKKTVLVLFPLKLTCPPICWRCRLFEEEFGDVVDLNVECVLRISRS